jgi:D-Tyr-tRNAtyr deacylase
VKELTVVQRVEQDSIWLRQELIGERGRVLRLLVDLEIDENGEEAERVMQALQQVVERELQLWGWK